MAKKSNGSSRRELITSPSYLVAIFNAARMAGYRDLEKLAKDELASSFGIRIASDMEPNPTVGSNDSTDDQEGQK